MAIDDEDKRRSVISMSPATSMLPRPEGAIFSADKQQLCYVYRGILAAGGVPEPEEVAGNALIIGVI